jgi:hypothetical protein
LLTLLLLLMLLLLLAHATSTTMIPVFLALTPFRALSR